MALEFRILGPLEVVRDGRVVRLGGPRDRTLLAILLVHANEVVSTDRIFDELYGESPPPSAASSLQNAVSKLRKRLGADAIQTRSPGYALELSPDSLDAARFEQLLADAPNDSISRAEALREALDLWRGHPLADFAYEPFAQSEIARLEELRLVALEERFDADLALGQHAVLVGELRSLIAEHPYRERLRRQLMLALYGAGRQADALEAYQQARRTFADELGIEPSAGLRDLERAILQQDETLVAPPSRAVPAVAAPQTAERRQTVTVLFADVVHSTRLARALDPEALAEVMARYFASVRRVLERHGGTVEKFIGDAVLGVFGVPRIHEDDALRAVRAATAVLDALAELNGELSSNWGVEIAVRTGINTGEVVTGGAHELLASGQAVNLAKRLEEMARAGEILIGEATWRLVRDAVEARPVELGEARDVERAWRVERVRDAPPFTRRLETPLVGRERELERLRQALDQAVAGDRAHLLTVLEQAGIGKTRLALEFAASAGDALVLTGRCPSFGEALTYWPLREIAVQAGERGAALRELLEGGSAERILLEARSLCETLARERPLVVVLEDLHWAEPTFLDLVEYLGERIREAPVLLLCLARAELLEARSGWGGGLLNATSLLLEPLSTDESEALIEVLLGTSSIDEGAKARLIGTAEGNPLFAEQLLSAVLLGEAGELPPTIEALLAARLDRLGPGERAVVEVGAVAGREFTVAAVAELLPPEAAGSVDRHLANLVRRELVRPLRAAGAAEEAFSFRHVLVRDAAYRSTPKASRAKLHRRFADRLERHEPDGDELIGYHLERAYGYQTELRAVDEDARRLAAAAGDRLARAGIRTWKSGDVPAALNLLERTTALLPEGERRRELLCELALARRSSGDSAGGRDLLARTVESSEAAGDVRVGLRARIELADFRLNMEPGTRAAELIEAAEEAIPVFEAAGDDRSLGRAWMLLGSVRGDFLCRNRAWEEAAERAFGYYERSGWPVSRCAGAAAAALYHGPVPVEDAIRRCRALGERVLEREPRHAGLLLIVAALEAMRGRFDEARALYEEGRETYEELGQRVSAMDVTAWASAQIEGWAGDLAAADRILRETCARFGEMSVGSALASNAADLADVLFQQGADDEAEHWSRVSEAHAGTDDVSAQVSWRSVRAKIAARRGELDTAVPVASRAVAIVRETDGLNRQAKALLDLAEVYRLGDRSKEALPLVAEALELYERKGNVVAAERTRRLREEPAPA